MVLFCQFQRARYLLLNSTKWTEKLQVITDSRKLFIQTVVNSALTISYTLKHPQVNIKNNYHIPSTDKPGTAEQWGGDGGAYAPPQTF